MERLPAERRAQVHGGQRRMPIVRVQHPRLRGDFRKCGERRDAEEGEAQGVVRVVSPVVAINARAIEEVGVLDEEHLWTGGCGRGAVEPRVLDVPAERDGQRVSRALQGRRGLAHQLVQRHHDRGGMAGGGLGGRQAGHRLTQSARAGEGPVLGRQVGDADPLGDGDLRPRGRGGGRPPRVGGAAAMRFRRSRYRDHDHFPQTVGGSSGEGDSPRTAGA